MTKTKKPSAHVQKLIDLGACSGPGESIEFVERYATAQEAWDACKRSDWMLWLWRRVGPKDAAGAKVSARLAVACARTAIPFVKTEEDRTEMVAILDGLDGWALGTIDNMNLPALRRRAQNLRSKLWHADAAAYAAAYAAYAADAAVAAYDAAVAAYDAAYDAAAAYADAYAAADAAVAAYDAAADAAVAAYDAAADAAAADAVAAYDAAADAAVAAYDAAADAAAAYAAYARQKHRALMADEIRKILPVCPL